MKEKEDQRTRKGREREELETKRRKRTEGRRTAEGKVVVLRKNVRVC